MIIIAGGIVMNRSELKNKINNACDIMRQDGLGIMDYMEQLSWLFFLKAVSEQEEEYKTLAQLKGKEYEQILPEKYTWDQWAEDDNLTGDELIDFVNNMFQELSILAGTEMQDMIGVIFTNLRNHMRNGYSLREVINKVDEVKFATDSDVIVLSEIYESLLQDLNEAGAGGEYYTPRHIIQMMIKIVEPEIGDKIYDPAAGTCGFLTEAFTYFKEQSDKIDTEKWEQLREKTFFAREKSPRTYIFGIMNMIIHGIDQPHVSRSNTLSDNIRNVQEKEKYDVIMTNPPYGGKEGEMILQNFPIKIKKTEALFLQHIMSYLKKNGKAAVIVPDGVLFRGGKEERIRKKILEEFNLHTVISLPAGVFLPYTPVKTNIIFFDNTHPTKDVWFYELHHDGYELKPTRKPNPKNNDIPDLLEKINNREESEQSWLVEVDEIAENNYNLTASRYNPNPGESEKLADPEELLTELLSKEQMITEELNNVLEQLTSGVDYE